MSGQLAPLISGISDGVFLFLIASGLTLIFGVMGLINMAHGAYYMFGAYLIYVILAGRAVSFGWFLLAIAAAAVATAGIGIVTERLLIRRLYRQAPINSMLGTYALLLILQGLAQWIWGTAPVVQQQTAVVNVSFSVGGIQVPRYSIMVAVLGVLTLVAIQFLLTRTHLGAQIRAVSEDRWMAALLGIPVARVSLVVIALGTLLAGLGGALTAPTQGITPDLAVAPLITAFAVVIVGGLGSIYGAALAALLLAILNSYIIAYLPALANYTIYVAMLAILLFRPQGLLGSAARTGIK
ncbi:MAG: branched-chain amino acid ABC transporter permease [Streptosporangiaceae bacterium]